MNCAICGRPEQAGIPFMGGAAHERAVHRVCWISWATNMAMTAKAVLEAGRK